MVMLLFGLVIAMAFSTLTLNYFSDGIDRGIGLSMRESANIEGVKEGKPVLILGCYVAASWEDLPEKIRRVFNHTPPEKLDFLQKKVFEVNIFGPPDTIYLSLKVVNNSGQVRYIAKYINRDSLPFKPKEHSVVPHIAWIATLAIILIAFVMLVVWFIIRKVTKPVESLMDWAKSLDENKLNQPIPNFQYSELNLLAEIIKSSLNSVQQTLDRELKFLSYASHELRTPISVVRANTELLIKRHEKEGGEEKQLTVLKRIDRASKTMTSLIDTLLWLSRDDANLADSEKVDIAQLIEQLVGELSYLLKSKPVSFKVDVEPYIVNAAAIPCRIILANLIRNAFQHTIEGTISISQCNGDVTIVNSIEGKVAGISDLGFGLGLQLTKKLAGRYKWAYSENIEATHYQVKISFEG